MDLEIPQPNPLFDLAALAIGFLTAIVFAITGQDSKNGFPTRYQTKSKRKSNRHYKVGDDAN